MGSWRRNAIVRTDVKFPHRVLLPNLKCLGPHKYLYVTSKTFIFHYGFQKNKWSVCVRLCVVCVCVFVSCAAVRLCVCVCVCVCVCILQVCAYFLSLSLYRYALINCWHHLTLLLTSTMALHLCVECE